MKYLVIILVLAFALRMYNLDSPKTYYFDEVYHAVTAKLYARNDPRGYEWWHEAPEPNTAIEWLHPPIAKLTQAASIKVFGENSFGWRFSSVVFSLGVIAATYLLALQLFKAQRIAILAAFLTSIDGLLFAQSRIAMNDIHVVFFILLSLLVYAKYKEEKSTKRLKYLLVSGVFGGLAVSTKWSGIFVLGVFGADQILAYIRTWKFPSLVESFRQVVSWLLIPFAIYVLSYAQFWLQGHTISQFVELHQQIWYYQTHLTATHPYQSKPLQWVLDLRPVWLYVDYSQEGKIANIYNLGNPVIFYAGLIAVIFLAAKSAHKFSWNQQFLALSYLLVWFPWVFSPRIMFFYHYAPAVPMLCIALATVLHRMLSHKKKVLRLLSFGALGLAIVWFGVFFPDISGLHVPLWFAERVYFVIPSWR